MHSVLCTVSNVNDLASYRIFENSALSLFPSKYIIVRNSIFNCPFPHSIEIATNVERAKVWPRITRLIGEFMESYHADVDLTHDVHT
jgi:hypothetical protein